MHQPMKGVRVLEVAQFWFVPSAGAVLADENTADDRQRRRDDRGR
jgi:hypothetical protein